MRAAEPKSVELTPAGTTTTWRVLVDAGIADQLFEFGRVGSMNGTPSRVTRQPALS